MQTLKIICPNGHLGFAPMRVESFQLGVAARPDYIAADSGSDDVGPVPLGSDTSTSPLAWQTHDLEQMLLASRRLGVPMIIGSAGDTGTNSRVDLYVRIIKELAAQASADAHSGSAISTPRSTRTSCAARCARATTVAGLDGRRRRSTKPSSTPPSASSRWPACIPSSSCCGRAPTSSSAGAAATAPCSPRPRSITAFPRISRTTSARCWNARRSAPSPTAARRRCWARSPHDDVKVTAMHPGAALHRRLGRRARDVRALEPVRRATSPAARST